MKTVRVHRDIHSEIIERHTERQPENDRDIDSELQKRIHERERERGGGGGGRQRHGFRDIETYTWTERQVDEVIKTYTVKYLVSAHYHVSAHPPLLD